MFDMQKSTILAAVLGLLPAAFAGSGCQSPVPAASPASPPVTLASGGARPATSAGPFTSISALGFGPDQVLFLADSSSGRIHALALPAPARPAAKESFNVKDLDAKVAALLGVSPSQVRVHDLAIHPVSKEAYLAVAFASGDRYVPAVAVVEPSGRARLLDLTTATSSVTIPFTPPAPFAFYRGASSRDLTFTDLTFHKGRLYVAGLSNADFASSLWSVAYPFTESRPEISSVEIYHTNHNEQETRAPIRTMLITELNGVDYVIAAYTCTPLVVFPLSAVKDGAHINGKVVAELGYGNTPIDLLRFTAQDMQQHKYPVLFLSNKNQAAQVIGIQAIEKAAKGAGLTTFQGFKKSALEAFDAPMTDILQADEQDEERIVTIRRNPDDGTLQLVSFAKNLYFRLSDFQAEFDFPSYKYPPGSDFIHGLQNQMRKDEGFPDLVK